MIIFALILYALTYFPWNFNFIRMPGFLRQFHISSILAGGYKHINELGSSVSQMLGTAATNKYCRNSTTAKSILVNVEINFLTLQTFQSDQYISL